MSKPNEDNASYTFRGFRLQALYAVYKIFTSSNEFYFEPEGAEDLAVYDVDKNLIEAIQVKSGDSNLCLGDFKSSFFDRSIKRKNSHPQVCLSIVKFGPIGPELTKACEADGKERQSVINKLIERKDATFTDVQLHELFDSIHIKEVVEEDVRNEIDTTLKKSLVGVDVVSAFDLLAKWIDDASEFRILINKNLLEEKIVIIGRFLKGREAYHQQWFSTIIPIEDVFLEEPEQDNLAISYYQGEAARFSHILLNLDVKRSSKLEEMHQMLTERNVLFVRGASGQGKSTLAYRFLYEYYPQTLRFQIKSTENRNDALTSAFAISEHVKALDLPAIVYMDVSPHDVGWEELVKSLSTYSSIQLLITIREEDWKKSQVSGVEFLFHEIDLQFEQTEAEQIFNVLFERGLVKQHLAFFEAWEEFGGHGPLLEFVYLVTQGGRLQERLQSQVDQLTNEMQPGENTIFLLRTIAIATSCGARISVSEAVNHFRIVPEKVFKRLESEYLLRLDENKAWINAFHPLRSVVLEQILLDSGYAPWIEQIESILKLLHPEDVEIFLLHAFLNHFNQRHELLKILYMYNPKTWEATQGVIRALSWLDVREFIENRIDVIHTVYDTREGHVVLFLGADIARISNNVWSEIIQSAIFSEDRRKKAEEIRNRLGIERFEFEFLSTWLNEVTITELIPKHDKAWSAFATVCLWLWKCKMTQHKCIAFDWSKIAYDDSLSIETVGQVTRALFYAYPEFFTVWTDLSRTKTLENLYVEKEIIEIEESDESVKAHFISIDLRVNSAENAEDINKNLVHEKTLQIIDLLHLLYPEKNHFATQGYGHKILGVELHDDSVKNIAKENLHIPEFVAVNANFRRIINNFFRPDDWQQYIEEIIELRQEVLRQYKATILLLNQFFQSKKGVDPLRKSGKISEWQQLEEKLRHKHLLPKSVVDQWGFSDEDTEVKKSDTQNSIFLSSKRYALIQKYLSSYFSDLGNFFTRATLVFDINSAIGKYSQKQQSEYKIELQEKGIHIDDIRLSWINLIEAKNTLPLLQNEFGTLFEHIIEGKRLHVLEQEEKLAMQKLAQVWFAFIHHSNTQSKHADKEFIKRFEDRKQQLLMQLMTKLNLNETDAEFSILKEFPALHQQAVLWIKVEHNSAEFAWHACFEALLLSKQFIKQQSEFSQTVMQWHWPAIHFVPVSNDYSINEMLIPLKVERMIWADSNDEINPLHHIPKKLSDDELNIFGLNHFESDETDILNEIFELASKLLLYLLHLKEFKTCPDASTEAGRKMSLSYTEQINVNINEVFNEALCKCSAFTERLQTYDDSESLKIKSHFEELLGESKTLGSDEMAVFAETLQENIGVILSEIIPMMMDLYIKKLQNEN